MSLFVVINTRGPAWDDAKIMDDQEGWAAHAAFMDALTEERFILLGGPLEGTRDAMLVVQAEDLDDVRRRLEVDPWRKGGHLILKDCWPWRIRLGTPPSGSV